MIFVKIIIIIIIITTTLVLIAEANENLTTYLKNKKNYEFYGRNQQRNSGNAETNQHTKN